MPTEDPPRTTAREPKDDADGVGAETDPYPVPFPDEPATTAEVVEETIAPSISAFFEGTRGVLPPPRWVQEYEDVFPGFARAFFEAWVDETRLVREEQEHRHRMNEQGLEGELGLQRRGQDYAMRAVYIVVGTGLAVFIVGVLADSERLALAGVGLIGSVVVGLATVFIVQRLTDRPAEEGPTKPTPSGGRADERASEPRAEA